MTAKPKILLVDDDPQIVENLSSFLSMNGFDAIAAEDGAAALRRLEDDRPDVIVLDVNLPKMSGVEVLEEMQQREDTVPVIVMTAYGRDNDLDIIALNSGAIHYLDKPFRNAKLLACINAILNLLKEPARKNALIWDRLRVDLGSRQVFWKDERKHLPERPFELLVYLMKNSRIHLTHNQILLGVWGSAEYSSNVIARAKSKIIDELPGLNPIIEGRDRGYIFDAKVVRT